MTDHIIKGRFDELLDLIFLSNKGTHYAMADKAAIIACERSTRMQVRHTCARNNSQRTRVKG